MRKFISAVTIAWNWLWLRVWVLLWCIQHGRVGQFSTAVAYIEEERLKEIRRLVWELRQEGVIRGEYDEDGELRLYPVDDREDSNE